MTARTRGRGTVSAAPSVSIDSQRGPGDLLRDALLRDVFADWLAHGAQAVASVRAERPHDYLKLVVGLIPEPKTEQAQPFDELTDEQLSAELANLLAQLGPENPPAEDGSGET